MADLIQDRVRIGTSGWHYPKAKEGALSWDGLFYPSKQRGVKALPELEYYSQFYNTVEVNLTFYHLPRLEMVQGWPEREVGKAHVRGRAVRLLLHLGGAHAHRRADPGGGPRGQAGLHRRSDSLGETGSSFTSS